MGLNQNGMDTVSWHGMTGKRRYDEEIAIVEGRE
jgi:hypothetical protein